MQRRAKRRDALRFQVARWFWAIALTLALHAALVGLMVATGFSFFGKATPASGVDLKPVALRQVDSSAWAANRSLDPKKASRPSDPLASAATPKPPEPKPEEKKEPEPIPKGKVVDVAPGNGQVPEESDFLAETNNKVEKQTRSKHATPLYKNAAPRPSTTFRQDESRRGGRDQVDRDVIAGNDGKGHDEQPERDGRRKSVFELPSIEGRDRLSLRFDGIGGDLPNREESDEVRGNSDRLRIQAGGDEGGEGEASAGMIGSRELRTLAPSAAVIDRIAGAPASDLTPMDDVEEGEGTYLNTREWKYSSFFNRVKQNVGMHWDPNTVARTRDPTGEVFLYKDRYTVLSVILDSRGLLKDVVVDKSCGVEFLDREAVSAFRRAQPFPNPPPGLQNDRGEIRFTFGFFLEVNKSAMRIFRPAN